MPDALQRLRKVDALQAGAILERAVADEADTVSHAYVRQAAATSECLVADALYGMANAHTRQSVAVAESIFINDLHRRWNLHRCQPPAIAEGIAADAFHLIADANGLQRAAVVERIAADALHREGAVAVAHNVGDDDVAGIERAVVERLVFIGDFYREFADGGDVIVYLVHLEVVRHGAGPFKDKREDYHQQTK